MREIFEIVQTIMKYILNTGSLRQIMHPINISPFLKHMAMIIHC